MLKLLNKTQLRLVRKGGTVTLKKKEGVYVFRLIEAYQARNYDGSLASWNRLDPRSAIEVKFVPKQGRPRYTNIWGQ